MYRAPEILDTYSNYPIGEHAGGTRLSRRHDCRLLGPTQDIWALGCILVYLCYGRHPFEDSAKLAIVNANYKLPKEETQFTTFHPIIENLLQPNPYDRTMLGELIESLKIVAVAFDVDLRTPLTGLLEAAGLFSLEFVDSWRPTFRYRDRCSCGRARSSERAALFGRQRAANNGRSRCRLAAAGSTAAASTAIAAQTAIAAAITSRRIALAQ